jgi:hypothetical protein
LTSSIEANRREIHGKDLMISSLANISDIGPSSYRQGVVVDFHCAYRQSRELYRFYQQEQTFLHTHAYTLYFIAVAK